MEAGEGVWLEAPDGERRRIEGGWSHLGGGS
jgi:hypothetical protein